jgi:hypothetical protein
MKNIEDPSECKEGHQEFIDNFASLDDTAIEIEDEKQSVISEVSKP